MLAPVKERRRTVVTLLGKYSGEPQLSFIVHDFAGGTGKPSNTGNPHREVPILHGHKALVKTSGFLKLCPAKKARGLDRIVADVAASLECSRASPKPFS